MSKRTYSLFALASLTVASSFGSIAFNGFETGTGDWTFDGAGDANGSITKTPSGTGPLGLTAFDGSNYATVHNETNGYSMGYGVGGFSQFGFSSAPPYPGSAYSQSIAVYIDTGTAAGPDAGTPSYWIDDAPSSTDPNDVSMFGGTGLGGEHNFRLLYSGTDVSVTVDGQVTPIADITTSGWYVFQTVFFQTDSNPTDLSGATLSILNAGGNQVGISTTVANDSDGDPLQNQYLAGPGYMWLPVWQDGFSNDLLAIDDVRADIVTPEPASIGVSCLGLLLVAGVYARRRRAV